MQGVSVDAGVFGDFEAAHDFHGVAGEVHGHHVQKFTNHAERLTDLSGKGQDGADAFAAGDDLSKNLLDQQMCSGG